MGSSPLVSTIIIFFNAETFFVEALESVLAQTYDQWELILADDGSTDESTAIAQRYAQTYPDKVRYVEHEGHQNRGMSATRNLGIRYARGEFIAFLDADDAWLPQKLEQQVAIMQAQPEAAMVYGKSLYWQSWTGKLEDQRQDYIPDAYVEADTLYSPPVLLTLCYPLSSATQPPPTDILLRRSAVEKLGGFEAGFQGANQLYEDQAFFAKLYLQFSVFVSSQCWDQYRLHPKSCGSTVNKAGQYHQVRSFFLNWFETYLIEHDVKDPAVWNALKRSLFPYRYPRLYKLQEGARRVLGRVKRLKKQVLP